MGVDHPNPETVSTQNLPEGDLGKLQKELGDDGPNVGPDQGQPTSEEDPATRGANVCRTHVVRATKHRRRRHLGGKNGFCPTITKWVSWPIRSIGRCILGRKVRQNVRAKPLSGFGADLQGPKRGRTKDFHGVYVRGKRHGKGKAFRLQGEFRLSSQSSTFTFQQTPT